MAPWRSGVCETTDWAGVSGGEPWGGKQEWHAGVALWAQVGRQVQDGVHVVGWSQWTADGVACSGGMRGMVCR